MKRLLMSVLAAAASLPAFAADVGVSVTFSEPGVYGRVDIGRFPQPQLVVPQPVVIQPPARVVAAPPVQPIYMWVPYDHRKDWARHCARYHACGVPVYFVKIGTAARLEGNIKQAISDGFDHLVETINPPILKHVTNPLTNERGYKGKDMPIMGNDVIWIPNSSVKAIGSTVLNTIVPTAVYRFPYPR